jgi:hypothetical protein
VPLFVGLAPPYSRYLSYCIIYLFTEGEFSKYSFFTLVFFCDKVMVDMRISKVFNKEDTNFSRKYFQRAMPTSDI